MSCASTATLANLRQQIEGIERIFTRARTVRPFHVPEIDAKLPGGGLALGALHEIGSYGFPESHAFSFAIIAEASSWMKCHHPDVFLAAILNSQPMGFCAPAQLIRDAKMHGVEIRWFCVNASRWDCTSEPTDRPGRFAVRLGYRLIKGIHSTDVAHLILCQGEAPYRSIPDLWAPKHPCPPCVNWQRPTPLQVRQPAGWAPRHSVPGQ